MFITVDSEGDSPVQFNEQRPSPCRGWLILYHG